MPPPSMIFGGTIFPRRCGHGWAVAQPRPVVPRTWGSKPVQDSLVSMAPLEHQAPPATFPAGAPMRRAGATTAAISGSLAVKVTTRQAMMETSMTSGCSALTPMSGYGRAETPPQPIALLRQKGIRFAKANLGCTVRWASRGLETNLEAVTEHPDGSTTRGTSGSLAATALTAPETP